MAVTKKIRKIKATASDEFTAVDVAERDAQGRKIIDTYATKGEIPTALPANGGNADYATTAGNADKCNNHTLGCDVPANADFTNTWPSAYIASISKSGNTLTITPNSGSALTFTNTTYSNATTSSAGLMSAADKTKLNGIDAGAEKNKITEIQVDGVTVEPDASGVVKITSSGGAKKYLHTCVFVWDYVLDGSDRYTGSLSFQFTDDHADSYQSAGAQYTATGLFNFLKQHCFLNASGEYKVSGGGYYSNSSNVRQEEQRFDSLYFDGYSTYYYNGTYMYSTSSTKYPQYGNGMYIHVIPSSSIMLYDKVMEA